MLIKGRGSAENLNLIVVGYTNGVAKGKDGKPAVQYLDVQRDLRDPAAAGETSPHAATYRTKDKQGKDTFGNGVRYSIGQLEAIKAAAGDNWHENPDNGQFIGSLNASVFIGDVGPKGSNDKGVIINTKKPLTASEYPVDKDTITHQIETAKANREAAKAAEADKAPEAAAETPEAPAAEEKPKAKTARKSRASKPAAEVEAAADEPSIG